MSIPLNVKTDYSLLNSLIKIDDLINFLIMHNIKECGICDDNLSGSIEFYNKCLINKIKPIIGLEIKYQDKKINLFAKNYEGYKNLLKINSLEEINITNLTKYSNHIICILNYSSMTLFSEFSFYDDLYLGYQNDEEKLSSLIMTDKVIYFKEINCFKEEDYKYFNYLHMLGGNAEPSNIINLSEDNTFISSLIDLKIPKNERYIPVYKENPYEFLKALANKGLEKRIGKIDNNYLDRLNFELNVIKKMNFVDYFLIVYDYVLYAKKNNILVGPGRGSAAGSLVCYAIGITEIDPLKYNLLFERFLNPERISMPDIDIDFDANKREDIINYVRQKYGENKVAGGLTYNTLKSRLVIREVGKLLKIDDNLINKFIKNINSKDNLKGNYQNDKVKKYLETYPELKKVYEISLHLEGLKKNISIHAAGIVISSIPLNDVIPTIKLEDNHLITGITMEYLEDLGLLKMDFLSLRNLSIMASIIDKIGSNPLNNLDLEDKLVLKLFYDVKTDGIFQYETYMMKKLLTKLKITSFNDLIASIALVRPGPSSFQDEYILRKEGKVKTTYLHPLLEPILKETYGIILYQEQIINILVNLASFSKSEADLVRRAISKKKDFASFEEKFIKGCYQNKISEKDAKEIFNLIIKFSDYGFNKSHSVAYALIGYEMAYLKAYYPNYFINELLNNSKDLNLIKSYLNELKSNGIKIIKPSIINHKKEYYLDNKEIILPLSIIKGISKDIEEKLIISKNDDLYQFLLNNKEIINKEIYSSFVYAGAFDVFNTNRQTLIMNQDKIFNYLSLNNLKLAKPILTSYDEYNEEEIRDQEYQSFGFYLGNHPSSKYQDARIMKLNKKEDYLFKNVCLFVLIEQIKKVKTKKGEMMAFLSVSDETDNYDLTVFPSKINVIDKIAKNDFVKIDAKVSKSFDKISIIVNNIISKEG